ncbi:DUF192 domain-containing protein [Paenibacillus sp. BSR1-1]|uniref:DUF192 domain-containing protein n=1 Tax=Paenibacillus sp. BSR1-1 TaxID=3020845 RepID=UPI0025B11F74|nr:DUF192 domain-containing protein [Paenibacillus sp. BSR1-1]MDN3019730.1 DUF192 domain-containing protein [Paenibacillus sp. BSR1-1]
MEHSSRTLPYSINRADSFFKRLKGLMFRKDQLVEEGLWIVPCNSIHMCFMNFDIDAVFLNKEGQIVKMVEKLKPWKFVKPVQNAYSVIELPPGTVAKLGLKQGDMLKL